MRGSRNNSCPPHGHVSFTGNAKGARKRRGGFLKENMKTLNWNLQRGGGNKPNLLWMAGGGGWRWKIVGNNTDNIIMMFCTFTCTNKGDAIKWCLFPCVQNDKITQT